MPPYLIRGACLAVNTVTCCGCGCGNSACYHQSQRFTSNLLTVIECCALNALIQKLVQKTTTHFQLQDSIIFSQCFCLFLSVSLGFRLCVCFFQLAGLLFIYSLYIYGSQAVISFITSLCFILYLLL